MQKLLRKFIISNEKATPGLDFNFFIQPSDHVLYINKIKWIVYFIVKKRYQSRWNLLLDIVSVNDWNGMSACDVLVCVCVCVGLYIPAIMDRHRDFYMQTWTFVNRGRPRILEEVH